jgi:hypothetical protein
VFTLLIFARVAGQLVVASSAPRWLPPMEHWQSGLLPYPALLAGQAVVLVLMIWISVDFSRASGFWVDPKPRLGLAALVWSGLYFSAMIVRYIIRMARRPDQRGSAARFPSFSLGRGRVSVGVRDVTRSRATCAAASAASRPMFNSAPRIS